MVAGGWVGQDRVGGGAPITVHNPWDGSVLATVEQPRPADVERAVQLAAGARDELARTPAHRRSTALHHIADRLRQRLDEFAELITAESGKPIRWSRGEVRRAASTFRWAAEEANRWSGELQRLDTDPADEGRLALLLRVPRGPILGITPFNFPLNLVAHKVAPALAVGAPIVLKPAPATPLSALALGEIIAECDLPAGAFSVLCVDNAGAADLVADPRLPVVSFTGSGPVGWSIRDAVPRKHVALELGGNAAVLVCDDWSSPADLEFAARRIALCANYQGGQSCISVQRVLVDRAVHEAFLPRLLAAVADLRTGDPRDPDTDVGPLIDAAAADRVHTWVQAAVDAGARLLTGGTRTGAVVAPTVLTDVDPRSAVACDEVFGPVMTVETVDGLTHGLRRINDSRFGIHAGVLTHDLATAFRAHRELEVGGVIIGDVPTVRAEQLPYGGVKESGIGREGVRSAMEDFTDVRTLVLSGLS
ncbi:aldehyde dehydrogenase family protein [Nakamurella flava]|uniref:Aldehyde dehydrogenase family protein n=2 Tax=Nakamurella flava TaxID=2576308 RepID=A0A4U6QCY2_9ACTN|nr:aldehyde dehydrogenase family protein [Nakamurella flava]